jgi:2-polyprenyl-6-methoxyphenol hydroxylase-like FAD-dependent oxidoreductase
MAAIENILIIGGGTVGCAMATLLAREGISVDLLEIREQADYNVHGSGITLMGPALRVLKQLGVLPQIEAAGLAYNSAQMFSKSGAVLANIPLMRTGGTDLPAVIGMTRPKLADILATAARNAGARFHFGASVASMRDDGMGVDVRLSNGEQRRYDTVVAADGIRSATRQLLDIHLTPQPLGVGLWRVQAPRPAGVEGGGVCHDGPFLLAGFTPTGENSLYSYLIEPFQDRPGMSGQDEVAFIRERLGQYAGPFGEIGASVSDPERINFTVAEWLLMPDTWHRGRIVFAGDAVHACPPTFALGAAMGLEDAQVLAELLVGAPRFDESLFVRYRERRLPRVQCVVTNSIQMVNLLLDHSAGAKFAEMVHATNVAVAEPA